MNNTGKGVLIGVFSAIGGALVSWFVTKKYCDKIKKEEIESVKSVFTLYATKKPDESKGIDAKEAGKSNYIPKSSIAPQPIKSPESIMYDKTVKSDVRVITYDDFGTIDDYGSASLTLYADNYLCNDRTDEQYSYEKYVVPFEDSFDDEGCLYIRDDSIACDFEIEKCSKTRYEALSARYKD